MEVGFKLVLITMDKFREKTLIAIKMIKQTLPLKMEANKVLI